MQSKKKSSAQIQRIIYQIIIGIILIIFWSWLVLNYLQRTENANSVISHAPILRVLTNNVNKELYKGDVLKGQFESKFPKLGIVSLRFKTYYRINSDRVIFRIREMGTRNWYYQNLYNTDQFQPNRLFTFGFPIIEQSQGKTYEFEIESSIGTTNNAISISSDEPILVSKHKYLYKTLLGDKMLFKDFLYNKIVGLLSDHEFVTIAFLYLLISLLFYIYASIIYHYISPMIVAGVFIVILIDIFALEKTHNLLFLTVFLTWIFGSIRYKISYESVIGMVVTLFGTGMVLEISDGKIWSHKAAAWTYILLVALIFIKIIRDNLKGRQ